MRAAVRRGRNKYFDMFYIRDSQALFDGGRFRQEVTLLKRIDLALSIERFQRCKGDSVR